jgi:hypothetical protein
MNFNPSTNEYCFYKFPYEIKKTFQCIMFAVHGNKKIAFYSYNNSYFDMRKYFNLFNVLKQCKLL